MGKRGRTVAEEKKIEGRRHIFLAVTDSSMILNVKYDCTKIRLKANKKIHLH